MDIIQLITLDAVGMGQHILRGSIFFTKSLKRCIIPMEAIAGKMMVLQKAHLLTELKDAKCLKSQKFHNTYFP